MKTTPVSTNRIHLSLGQSAFLLIPVALACFALAPQAGATCQDACLTNNNTVQGDDALLNLTTGTDNTALGFNALLADTTGTGNTAVGSQALVSITTGGANVAIGRQALFSSTTGGVNVAVGNGALLENTSGSFNTAIGHGALTYNNQGSQNVAIGYSASFRNETGVNNSAIGVNALFNDQVGSNNCAFGYGALSGQFTGSNNTAIGVNALSLIAFDNNVAIGYNAGFFAGGENNIFIGASAGYAVQGGGGNNIEIGANGKANDEGDIRIGTKGVHKAVHIAGIYGRAIPNGVTVVTDNLGHLGTVVSSERFKDSIKPIDKASEAILALKPVTFRYKHELDPAGIPQFGLVAEDVQKVNPALVACDEQGKPYTVRYEAVNAMLLNEFLKEHRKGQEQDAVIAQLKSAVAHQEKQIEALTAGLQKVSAQLELSKDTPQLIASEQ